MWPNEMVPLQIDLAMRRDGTASADSLTQALGRLPGIPSRDRALQDGVPSPAYRNRLPHGWTARRLGCRFVRESPTFRPGEAPSVTRRCERGDTTRRAPPAGRVSTAGRSFAADVLRPPPHARSPAESPACPARRCRPQPTTPPPALRSTRAGGRPPSPSRTPPIGLQPRRRRLRLARRTPTQAEPVDRPVRGASGSSNEAATVAEASDGRPTNPTPRPSNTVSIE